MTNLSDIQDHVAGI